MPWPATWAVAWRACAQSLAFHKIQVQLLRSAAQKSQTDKVQTALQETLQKFKQQTGLPRHFQISGEGVPLPADVQVQVLHVVQ